MLLRLERPPKTKKGMEQSHLRVVLTFSQPPREFFESLTRNLTSLPLNQIAVTPGDYSTEFSSLRDPTHPSPTRVSRDASASFHSPVHVDNIESIGA